MQTPQVNCSSCALALADRREAGETDEEKLKPMCAFRPCPVAPSMQPELFAWLDFFALLRDEHLDKADILRRGELTDYDLDILHRLNAVVSQFREEERRSRQVQSTDPRKIAQMSKRR